MSYETNPSNDYATGDADGPTREEVEASVLAFNDRWNEHFISADLLLEGHGDYRILVYSPIGGISSKECIGDYDRLWQFEDWATLLADLNERDLKEAA